MKWLFTLKSCMKALARSKKKPCHQAKEIYFSPKCLSSWLQQIGYGVYVLMSLVCDWKNDCVFFREFFYVICEKEK